MITHRRRAATMILTLAMSALAPAAGAYDGFVAPLQEVPLTAPLLPGARSAGMGGASLAVAEEAAALTGNPAALARLRRIELSGGLTKRSDDLSGTAFGSDFETSLSATDFSALRFAYPFPTFRGSLVFGLSAGVVHSFDDDFLSFYDDEIQWWEPSASETLTGVWHQKEDSIVEGGITAWTIGAAMDASPSVALGAAVSYWTGDYTRRFTWRAEDANALSDDYDSYQMDVSSTSDVSGFRAKLGALYYAAESVAIGLVVETPMTLTFDGSEMVSRAYDDVEEELPPTYFSDKLKLPFSFGAGVAYTPTDLVMIAGDIYYTDWSEMTYEGFLYLEDDEARVSAYEATTDIRLGAEVTVPSWPLRLRAGYMSRPMAYRGLEIDTDRSYFTLGAGLLIDTVLAIDVAWLKASYERSAEGYDYDEEVDDSALMLEAAYRF
jgi:long-subunit fatty acid transport protein